MRWKPFTFRRPRATSRRQPIRNKFRPIVEWLETRLAPANVSITSFHNDPSITGQNLQETVLAPANVNSTNFGKLASVQTDGYSYAQPLYVANLMINGTPHNVAFVATEHDSVYAFDIVNDPSSPTGVTINQLWQRSFITGGPGGPTMPGITQVPQPDVLSGDIVPDIGITGSPAIDTATATLYVVAKTKEVRADGNHWVQTLHALDVTTGADKYITTGNGGYVIGDTHTSPTFANETTAIVVPGAGAETSGGATPMVAFSALRENQRPSLQILNGRVYVGWASHGDNGPYHGWVVGFNETTLQPEKIFNTSPNGGLSGIWQSEGAISTDGRYLYFAVGNGGGAAGFAAFDPAHGNYSESVIKLDTEATGTMMPVADYFTPFNWAALDSADADLGSGGVMLLPDSVGSTAHPHLMVETGKDGHIYLIDRDNMGQFTPGGPNNIVQDIVAGPGGVWGNPAFYQENATTGLIIYHGSGSDTREFQITNGQITQVSPGNYIAYRSNQGFGFPGAQPIISGNGSDNTTAIDWELQVDNYGQQGPAILHAYAVVPGPVGTTMTELYNSNQAGLRDRLSGSVKFTSATETNGEVFAAQEFSFSVFGLFPTHTAAPAAPTNLSGMGTSPTAIQINWTSPSPNTATGIKIFRSAGDDQHYGTTPITTVAAGATTYTDTGLAQGQVYFYKIAATNQAGDSPFTDEIQASPTLAPPVLSADNVSSNRVSLVWSRPAVANDHYNVERSTDPNFGSFTTIATNLPGSQLSYTDTDPILVSSPGQYFYRVRAFTNPAGEMFALSNIVAVRVGPNSAIIDYLTGFPSPPSAPPPFDLQANGSAQFAETTARLTNATNQTASVFSVNEENILNWTTTFTVRLHEGTQPNYANGFAFVIQAIASGLVGQGGQGLGYQGLANSVAIKFDTYTNGTENGTGGSTGLFFGGDLPTTPHQTGEVNLPLDAASQVNLESQSSKTITLSYAYNPSNPGASILHEEIDDPDHPTTPFTHDYTVDIPSLLGLPANGNTIGYVGFTGSTGSGGFWELQDITGWRYVPTGPAAPHGLTAVAGSNAVDLSWKTTSADDEGYYVERSQDPTTGFTRIATLGAGVTTYHDPGLTNPQSYYYRVQAFNHDTMGQEQDSGYSNVATGAVVNISFPNFASHDTLTANTAGQTPPVNVFPGTPPVMQLTDGRTGEATSVFDNTRIGTGPFSTTFTLQNQSGPAGSADGAAFVIQSDPRGLTALGGAGGAVGYGGITNSVAVLFDLYSSGSHASTTKLLLNGSTDRTGAIDMGPSGITLGNGDPLQVTLTYDGTTLTETVTDTATHATFSHNYTVNLAQVIGGTAAYVGFSGGTGGEDATQDVVNWIGQFALVPPQASRLDVSANPTSSTAGQTVQITVTALDASGNPLPSYGDTVHLTSSDPQAVLPANYTFTAADMGVHTFTVTLKTAGNQTVTVTDVAQASINGSATVAVSPAATSSLRVFGFPGVTAPGSSGTFTVKAQDAYGNTTPGYLGTVHFTSSDAAATLPADYPFTAADMGIHTFTATLNTSGTQSITATDTATGTISGTESGIIVTQTGGLAIDFSGGFATHSTLTANTTGATPPVNVFPGTPPVMRLTDGRNSEATSVFYNTRIGTGSFTTAFTLQDHPNAGAADSASFVIQNDPRGTAALGGGGGAGGYGGIINSIALKFDLYTHGTHNPSTGLFTGGASPDSDPTRDVPLTGINLGSGDPLAVTLTYDGTTLTEMVTDMVTGATFSHSYALNLAQVIGAPVAYVGFTGGTGGENATQDIVNWSGQFSQAPTHLGISANPTTVTAGQTTQITVTVLDQNNNPVPGYTGTVHFMASNGAMANYTFTPADMGSHTFTVTLLRAGTLTITGTDTVVSSITGTTTLTVTPAALDHIAFTNPSTVTAGTPFSITVTMQDVYNNTVTGYTGTVHFTTSQGAQADYTFTPADMGSRTFTVTLVHAGTLTVTGTDTGGSGATGTTQITVTPAAATHLMVTGSGSASRGQAYTFTVTAYDAYGNVATGYTGTVTFASDDSSAALPASYTFTAADAGTHTFTATFNQTGTFVLRANDTGDLSITGEEDGIMVV
jgi:hypothetical protein